MSWLSFYHWFCCSVQTYLALPKGGMVPEHVLALPIGHYAASTDAPPVSEDIVYTYTVEGTWALNL